MAENPHYKELLQLLNEFEVEYLIVGGFAVMKYGEPRYTKDLDVWVHNSPHNSARIVGALRKFGAPLEHDGITTDTFTGKQVVYQIGIAPVRIDILTEITGVEFPQAWEKRVASTFFGVQYISSRGTTLRPTRELISSPCRARPARNSRSTCTRIKYPWSVKARRCR